MSEISQSENITQNPELISFSYQVVDDMMFDEDGHKQVFLDPITIAVVSGLIRLSIEILIPYIKRKCNERSENLIMYSRNPSWFMRWRVRRAVRRSIKETGINLASYQLDSSRLEQAIFNTTANSSLERIDYVLAHNEI